jgi:uncharacterized membrane protein
MTPSKFAHMLCHRFLRDDRGVASIVGVMLMILGLGFAIVVVDAGHLYLAKRRLQAAVDAAALAAAGDPASAGTLVAKMLGRNGYDTSATIEQGAYTADPSLAVNDRFASGATPMNAVRVTKTITSPEFFAGVLGMDSSADIAATATAARIPEVSFSAGTGLATLSNGALNQMLGALLGANLSLTAVNYNGLAAENIDALTFLNQLATAQGLSAGTYSDLANTTVTMGNLIAAAEAAINIHPGGSDTAALDALNVLAVQVPPGVSATLSQVVDVALWQKRQIGSIIQQDPGQITLNLLDLTTAMARIYGAGHLVTLNSAVTLPITGTGVTTKLVVGSPMASVGLSPVGTSIATSQVRLALVVTAANVNLGVASVNVSLPVYLQVASGQATAKAIPCINGGTMATISTQSQAVTAQIGSVTDSALGNFGSAPAVSPASVATVSVLGIPVAIQGSGALSVAAGPENDLNFTQADIAAGTVKTAAGSDAGQIFSTLAGNLTLTTSFNGGALTSAINSLLNATVLPLVKTTLASLLAALDPAVDTLLRGLGLRLGEIDVVTRGVSCGVPTLVH